MSDEHSSDDPVERVVYSMIRGAVRVAARFRIPLKTITQLTEMAYFHELRELGLTHREASGVLDVSMRKAARLSKSLRTNFFRPEEEHELPKRIEFLLWAEPLGLARIKQLLVDTGRDEVEQAVERLVAEGRVVVEDGRTPMYRIARSATRIVRPQWRARIGGLNSLVGTLARTVEARFFDDDERAFARNLSFHVPRDRVAWLRELYETNVWEPLKALDEETLQDPDSVPMALSLYWTPLDESDDE